MENKKVVKLKQIIHLPETNELVALDEHGRLWACDWGEFRTWVQVERPMERSG